MRIVSGGRWTSNGRWVVLNENGSIAYDPPGWYGDGYDLRERQIKMRGDGPHFDWPEDPDMKGQGEFTAWDAFSNLGDCWAYVNEHKDD